MRPGAAPMRTERWWAWQTTAGRRIYDVPIDCTKSLDFRKITGAWLSDNGGRALRTWAAGVTYAAGEYLNSTTPTDFEYLSDGGVSGATEPTWPTTLGASAVDGTQNVEAVGKASQTWYPLKQEMNPLEFSVPNEGMPIFFEIREYLEVWPVPDKTYVIWLKGHLGIKPFEQDTDECTIDSRLVFLMALANAKAHYGQPDGGNYFRQLEVMLGRLVASSHGLKRYIPNPRAMKGDYITWGDRPVSMPIATFR